MATASEKLDELIRRYQPGGDFSARAGTLVGGLGKQLSDEYLRNQVASGARPLQEPKATTRARSKDVTGQFGRELEATRTSGLLSALMGKAGYLESEEARTRGEETTRQTQSELTRKLQQLGNMAGGSDSLEYKRLVSELTGLTQTGRVQGGATWPIGGYSMTPQVDYGQVAAKQQVYSRRSIPDIQF